MLYIERQRKIEEVVYHSLEDIADEIGVTVHFYPEVYWVGRKLKFEDIGLANKYKQDFDSIRKDKRGGYLIKPRVILIGGYFLEDIVEEVGHFLHLTTSNIDRAVNLKSVDDFCLNVLMEMFGFFCSKLIKPSRKNLYKKYKDYLSHKPESERVAKKDIKIFTNESEYEVLSEVYHQGYGLGEELFNAYISNSFPKRNLRKLFSNSLAEKNEPLSVFLGLKYDLIKFMKNY